MGFEMIQPVVCFHSSGVTPSLRELWKIILTGSLMKFYNHSGLPSAGGHKNHVQGSSRRVKQFYLQDPDLNLLDY